MESSMLSSLCHHTSESFPANTFDKATHLRPRLEHPQREGLRSSTLVVLKAQIARRSSCMYKVLESAMFASVDTHVHS